MGNNRKIKICFILPNFVLGGAERVLINIIRKLDLNIFDIYLIVIDDFGEIKHYVPKHVTIINLDERRTRHSFLKLLKQLFIIKPDMLFSTHNRTNLLSIIISKFLPWKKSVIVREPTMPSAQFGSNYTPKYYLSLMRCFYPLSDLIIAQTDEMKSELIDTLKFKENKIKVITNPIDKEYLDKMALADENPFNKDHINIVTVGKLHPLKGYDILVKAFSQVVKTNKKFHLYIIGKQDFKDNCTLEICNLIKSLGLENNVTLTGPQKNPYKYLYHAELSVLTSRWEGMPNVVVESLYLKTPVVSTNCILVINRLINHTIDGYVCQIDNVEELASAILNYKTYQTPVDKFEEEFDWNDFFIRKSKRTMNET